MVCTDQKMFFSATKLLKPVPSKRQYFFLFFLLGNVHKSCSLWYEEKAVKFSGEMHFFVFWLNIVTCNKASYCKELLLSCCSGNIHLQSFYYFLKSVHSYRKPLVHFVCTSSCGMDGPHQLRSNLASFT